MNEFINGFGKDNFFIMLGIIVAIVLALVLIFIIEHHNSKKENSDHEYDNIANISTNNKQVIKNDKIEKSNAVSEDIETLEDVKQDISSKEEIYSLGEINSDIKDDEVYYEEKTSYDLAKEKLEEVTKSLIDEDSDLIDHTFYEVEQEEKSIISYEELLKASYDVDNENDKLMADEDDAAITIEELYRKHENEEYTIDKNEKPEVKVNNPVFEDEPRKFKNSDVISPVFGIYSGKEKKQDDVLSEMNKVDSPADLESEIRRTEDFLSELKRLKNKLD